ncbi:ATP-dependent sacrificial sulfur transferase LarE [Actinomycetospora sp. CA-053990]|uniref:ATP-dependent sacrificial sulfur transferase LarE n=1 Tax=Actinomycetospora sp. CA-053990 TaxID=3239891 RepID=UPI003D8B4CC8
MAFPAPSPADDLAALEGLLAGLPGAVVAFSGGVDSSVVAAVAARVLGERALAVTAVSPALATGEIEAASAVAAAIGVAHRVVSSTELDREGYRRNGRDRCYHCKTDLYDRLTTLAGDRVVLSGANADDLGDWRPGLTAAAEHGVRHPLIEAGLGKAQIRALAELLGLPSAAKPASPCLASRIPYGTPVSAPVLAQIDRAEAALHARGYAVLRVRHHGDLGRVQIAGDELGRVDQPGERAAVEAAVRAAGYREVEIDPHPFRSGSLNLEITPA